MKRAFLIAVGLTGLAALAATRLPAAPDNAIILPGTAGTTLAQEQQALKNARRQSDEARERSARLEQQASLARDEAE
ncbi:MAG: metalloendopeptidase, partial [Sphingobium sp.]